MTEIFISDVLSIFPCAANNAIAALGELLDLIPKPSALVNFVAQPRAIVRPSDSHISPVIGEIRAHVKSLDQPLLQADQTIEIIK